jgi:hypothetical protein
MHRIVRLACLLAAVLPAAMASAQAVRQLTVPNVTVTAPAPPVQPPYLRGDPMKSFARNPYFGRFRVEEANFPRVPCAQSRIAAVVGGNCLLGYRLTTGLANYALRPSGSENNCDMALDVVIYTVANLSVEADVVIFDPLKLSTRGFPDRDCYVAGFTGYDLTDFRDMNQVTRRGSNFRDLRGEGDAKSAEFSDGPHACAAIRRPGPQWSGGYVYMLTASVCHTDPGGLQPGDVARALAALRIRQYDAEGNLAVPPQ